MADIRIPTDNYPFSTKDGKTIPLDIIRPKGFVSAIFDSSSDALVTMPDEAAVVILISSAECIIGVGEAIGTPADLTYYENALYIPKNHAVTVFLPERFLYIRGLGIDGILRIQEIERWAGINLDINYLRR